MFGKILLVLSALSWVVNAELVGDSVVFSEILFKPTSGNRAEFIELYNPTNKVVNAAQYKVCNASGACTTLAGDLNPDSYYVLCRDISSYLFCRQATPLQLGGLTQLFIFKGSGVNPVDTATTPGTPPVGSAFTRGLNPSNLLEFSYSPPTIGVGYLGGPTSTATPTPAPVQVPGVEVLMINEISKIDDNKFVEIAFKVSTVLSSYKVTFYNAEGTIISETPLSAFTASSSSNGLTFAFFVHSVQEAVFGVALTGGGVTWDFVSIQSSIKATDGEAKGVSSTNLGSGSVFQRRGSGCDKSGFNWVAANIPTRGFANQNQFVTCTFVLFLNEIVFGLPSGNYIEFGLTEDFPFSGLKLYSITLYSRASQKALKTFTLDEATMGSSSSGISFGFISLDTSRRSLFVRGLASEVFDGVALSKTSPNKLLDFVSVNGLVFTAIDGPANGITSNDFPINQSGSKLFGGKTGTGCSAGDFAFGANGNTKGAINNGQIIDCSRSADGINSGALTPATPAPVSAAPTPIPTKSPTPEPTINTNECKNGESKCSVNAICTDTPTGYTCTCKTGFKGNGLICEDIDECKEITPYPCDATGGFCVDLEGSFKCGCLKGYKDVKGDGKTCDDIDECDAEEAPCPANTNCVNEDGSFYCECKPGFTGDPEVGCSDKNECASKPCTTNAFCTNTQGGFVCACNTGFTGDGIKSCIDINECVTSKPCDKNAKCTNNAGGFTCKCNEGFTGSGLVCAVSSLPPTRAPTTLAPVPTVASNNPSNLPTISSQPSRSAGPSITAYPSIVPSRSNEPSLTNRPSLTPSISDAPSITAFPSRRPSKKPTK